jgi:hypothetical protein
MLVLGRVALWVSILLLTASAHPAFAAPFCLGGVRLNFCKRCTIKAERSTARDTACSSQFNVSDYPRNLDLVIVGSSVAKQAQHGHVQMDSSSSWTYTPAKGYVGPDLFSIEWDFLSNGKDVFVVYAEQHMTVHP